MNKIHGERKTAKNRENIEKIDKYGKHCKKMHIICQTDKMPGTRNKQNDSTNKFVNMIQQDDKILKLITTIK